MSKRRKQIAASIKKDFTQPDKTDLSRLKTSIEKPKQQIKKRSKKSSPQKSTSTKTNFWLKERHKYKCALQDFLRGPSGKSEGFHMLQNGFEDAYIEYYDTEEKEKKPMPPGSGAVYMRFLKKTWFAVYSYKACEMSYAEIMKMLGCSMNYARKLIEYLEKAKAIELRYKRFGAQANVYRVFMPEEIIDMRKKQEAGIEIKPYEVK